jgi:class 3 adenylate cyclase/tetratricopeptide (TPR) repeat protein
MTGPTGGQSGERRVVTILFCDVKGSTGLAEQLDPEEWAEIMNAAFERIIEPVYRYGGTVARLMGDAMLAMFGAPTAHEDDPERAVLAGLGILESIKPVRAGMSRRSLDFNVRVGINTGLAVVGQVGSDLRAEYTAMGDAVNVAARMEQSAEPGTVQISGETRRYLGDLFILDELGGLEAKGKTEPIAAFRVTGVNASRPVRRGLAEMTSPMVGRDAELSALIEALQRLERGTGSIVTVIGEPGLGKSRLVEEARRRWEQERTDSRPWIQSRGISYRTDQAWYLLVQQLAALGASQPSDLEPLAEPARLSAPAVDALAVVLGAESHLQGEVLQKEIHGAVARLFSHLAETEPLVLVFEDLHWSDSASLGLVQHLVSLVEKHPILLLCCFRPDRRARSWGLKQYAETEFPHRYTEINLRPLSTEQTAELVTGMLDLADLPAPVRTRILERTEGNPFFAEEVVRTMIERGLIERGENGGWRVAEDLDDFTVPPNVQSLLLARLDRLDEEARRVLQMAAVIGRSFFERVLAIVSQLGTHLEAELLQLQRADLIREVARHPEAEYAFRHALTQEAAYDSILIKRRRQFHGMVGEALLVLAEKGLDVPPSVLARHFDDAGDRRASHFSMLAGDSAFRLYANAEAVAQYERAIRWADGGEERIADAYTRRGRALEILGRFDEALASYRALVDLGVERSDRRLTLAGRLARAGVMGFVNPVFDPTASRLDAEEALALAQQLGDPVAEVKALRIMVLLGRHSGRPAEGIAAGEKAVEIARRLDLEDDLAHTLTDLTWLHIVAADLDAAYRVNEEAVHLWRRLQNQPLLVDTLSSRSFLHLLRGDFDRLVTVAQEVYEISEPINNDWGIASASVVLGSVHSERGDYEQAISVRSRGAELAEKVGHIAAQIDCTAELAWTLGELGRTNEAVDLIERCETATRQKFPGWLTVPLVVDARLAIRNGDLARAGAALKGLTEEGIIANFAPSRIGLLIARAELAIAEEDYEAAAREIDHLLDYLHRTGARFKLAEAKLLASTLSRARGLGEEALALLEEARSVAEEQGADTILWRIHAARAEADPAIRDQAASAAAGIVRSIAARINDPNSRASYLARPEVASVLTAAPSA